MAAYFNLWRRFGWKMFGVYIVGNLAAFIPMIFLGILFVILLLTIGVTGVLGAAGADPFDDPAAIFSSIFSPTAILITILFLLFFFFVSLLVSAFTNAGSIGVVSETIQEERTAIGSFFRYGFRRLFPMLGLSLMLLLLAIPPMIPFIIAIVFFTIGKGWSITLGVVFVLFTILAYILYALIVLHAQTILIAERKGVFASIAASYRVFQKKFGEVILSALILLGIAIAGGLLTFILQFIIVGVSAFDPYTEPNPFRNLLGSIITMPIQVGLQLVALFTLVFRYLHVIQRPPTRGASPTMAGPHGEDPSSLPEDGPGAPEPPHQGT